MGFFGKKSNKQKDFRVQAETENKEIAAVTEEQEEEDDFAPIVKKSRPDVSREEFKETAKAEFVKAHDEADDKEDNNDGTETAEVPEDAANDEIAGSDDVTETVPADEEEDDFAAEETSDGAEVSESEDDEETDEETLKAREKAEKAALKAKNKTERQEARRVAVAKFKKKYKKAAKIAGICVGVLAICCAGLYIYGCATVPVDRMGRNVYIEDTDVSNLTYDEALEKLQSVSLLGNMDITLLCKGQSFTISGADVGMSAKLEDTVTRAMSIGKTGNIFIDGYYNTVQIFKKHTVIPNANVDEAIVRGKIAEFGRQVLGERVQHKLEIGDNVVIATPGHTGFDENTDKAFEQVTNALNSERFMINVTLEAGPPEPLTVDVIDCFVYKDPVDAYYDINGKDIMVIKELEGRYLNRDEAAVMAEQVVEGGEQVTIPYYVSYAAVTADELQQKLFNATLASYSTKYGTSTANRCANIANAAGKINGVILKPGEVFSFNGVVGKRSVANGFYTAKEYVNGETVDGIGGGTCQVSSTLYNAVLYADLSIVSRTNHMFPVSYCPIGQDATVADTGIDFKFSNNTDYPVKISAVTGGYTVTVSIIGTQRDDPRTVKIQNVEKKVGEDTSVRTTRYVYNSAGELIRTDDLGSSYYMHH